MTARNPRRLLAVGCVFLACAIMSPGTVNAAFIDCSPPTPWPQNPAPDIFQMALEAQRNAAAGKAAAQWLLGTLYLYGLGVPKDRDTAMSG